MPKHLAHCSRHLAHLVYSLKSLALHILLKIVDACFLQLLSENAAIDVSISSEVSPKFREYERANTTVANSYLKPVVSRYVAHLSNTLTEKGFQKEFFIMQSSGGLVSPGFVREFPIRIVESGPAAGVLMARDAATQEGFDQVISFCVIHVFP